MNGTFCSTVSEHRMYYIVDSKKSVNEAARDLDASVKRHNFGVLHVYDLKATLKSKGIELPSECRIFEVCNPQQAAAVLAADMNLSMMLPCRISVFEEDGRTKIGTMRPTQLLASLSDDPGLMEIACTVENAIKSMIDEAARAPTSIEEREQEIPGTIIFDGSQAIKGYGLNKMCYSFNDADNRAAFARDEDGYCRRYGLTPRQRDAVRRRDVLALIEDGANVYYLAKWAGILGLGVQDIGAQQTGIPVQEFRAKLEAAGSGTWRGS
jgi:protocatechuate 4,5-dioxygenase alpha subunit